MDMPTHLHNAVTRHHEVLAPGVRAALRLLGEAYQQAVSKEELWQFAVTLAELHEAGTTATDLRRLIRDKLVDYRVEVTTASSEQRRFERWRNMSMPKGSCFILTERGIELSRAGPAHNGALDRDGEATGPPDDLPRPVWDRTLRLFRWDKGTRKLFRQAAPRQTLILAAFEEQGWPERIDDPLPRERGIDPAQLLRNTLKNLNRTLRGWPIRFAADGTKRGILWQRVV